METCELFERKVDRAALAGRMTTIPHRNDAEILVAMMV
jgi:hypothetical protein